jgi:hypothetical protein
MGHRASFRVFSFWGGFIPPLDVHHLSAPCPSAKALVIRFEMRCGKGRYSAGQTIEYMVELTDSGAMESSSCLYEGMSVEAITPPPGAYLIIAIRRDVCFPQLKR